MGSASFKKQQKEDLTRLINNILSAHHVTRYSWTSPLSSAIKPNKWGSVYSGHSMMKMGGVRVWGKLRKSGKISSRERGWVLPTPSPFLLTPSLLLPNFLAHPRRAPSLARFSFACSISALPEKGKESAATQAKGRWCAYNSRTPMKVKTTTCIGISHYSYFRTLRVFPMQVLASSCLP